MSLHQAVEQQNIEQIKNFIQSEGSQLVNSKNVNEETPLHVAARVGNREAAMLLIQNGALVTSTDANLRTPLHYAAKNGHLEIVQILLDNNSEVNVVDIHKWTPLHMAVYHNHLNVVQLLCQRGALPNETTDKGQTPLHIACQFGYLPIIKHLLNVGARIDCPNTSGTFPLQLLPIKGIPPVDSDYVIIQLRECCRALKTLVNNPKSFPDVTFVVGTPPNEVKEIPAHKAILLARAPHLLKDINPENKIVYPNISYKLMLAILEFLYSGTIDFPNSELDLVFGFELVKNATELNLDKLKLYCENLILTSLDPETVITVYTVAKKYKSDRVEKYCCSLVITNFAAVWNKTKNISWNVDEILEIINHFEVEERKPPPLDEYIIGTVASQPLKPEPTPLPVVPPAFKEDAVPKKSKNQKTRKSDSKPSKDKKSRKQKQEVVPVTTTPSSTSPLPPKPKQPFDAMVGATYEEAKRILKELKRNPDAQYFLYPVDRNYMFSIGCGDYFSIIKQPMDFDTITKKLNLKQYRLLRNFAADVRLVFDNARIYNRPQSETQIYEMADRMSDLFERLYSKAKEKLGFPNDYDPPKEKTPEYFYNVFKQAIKELYPNQSTATFTQTTPSSTTTTTDIPTATTIQTAASYVTPTAPTTTTTTTATTTMNPATATTTTAITSTISTSTLPVQNNNVNVYSTEPSVSSLKKRKVEENVATAARPPSIDKSNIPLSDEEKLEMKEKLGELTEQQMFQILEIIKLSGPIDSNEVEVDLETLPIPIQRQLQQFILEATAKNKSQSLQSTAYSEPPNSKRQRVDNPSMTPSNYNGLNEQSRENGAIRARSRVSKRTIDDDEYVDDGDADDEYTTTKRRR